MKRILLALWVGALLVGCGKLPVPAGRLLQPAGRFSFVTPDEWHRSQLVGMDFIIVSTNADAGISPNIFVDGAPRPGTVSNQVANLLAANRAGIQKYTVIGQRDIATDSGLKGVKIEAQREMQNGLRVALFHYRLQDGARVISLTCSCADAVKAKYEPIFDAAMQSLRPER